VARGRLGGKALCFFYAVPIFVHVLPIERPFFNLKTELTTRLTKKEMETSLTIPGERPTIFHPARRRINLLMTTKRVLTALPMRKLPAMVLLFRLPLFSEWPACTKKFHSPKEKREAKQCLIGR
jgi:hypothetical protein